MLIKNAEINGDIVDLSCTQTVSHIAADINSPHELIIDARGCAVLPGLHDHHLHFFALVAARTSIVCDAHLHERLKSAAGIGWLRGVGYHEAVSGELDCHSLENIVSNRPVRVQHSSGKMWVLNVNACSLLGLEDVHLPGVERDQQGRVTGRLFRMDAWLGERIQTDKLSLEQVAGELLSYGLTGFTDASYTNNIHNIVTLSNLPLYVVCMGDKSLPTGHLKIMLDEDNLPVLDDLVTQIQCAHEVGRGVAFHCVSRIELVFALEALKEAGSNGIDRIEHGAIIPMECLASLADLALSVVTQPGFIATRGERYRRDVPGLEHVDLYRYQSLIEHQIAVAASSDAPYGPVNPWQVMQAAVERRTESGDVFGDDEKVLPSEALRSYLSDSGRPGGSPREITLGGAATFCILDRPLSQALDKLADTKVTHTIVGGELHYVKDPSTSSVCSPK